jgi:hypothetical protein
MTVVAATATKASIRTLKETTLMNMMTAAILGITAITAIILTISAAVSAAARAAAGSPATQVVPVATPPRVRRRAMRNSGVSRPIALIRPQYLPALARSRILRLRMLRAR